MGNSDEPNKPSSLNDSSPSQPLLSKPSFPSPIQEPPQNDSHESDPNQFLQISYNYGPRPFKDIAFLILFLLFVLCTFGFGIFAIFHRNTSYFSVSSYSYSSNSTSCVKDLTSSSNEIVPKNSSGEYTCEWKQDSWVPAYFTLAILTMLWSAAAMLEAQVYVISGVIAQWYFSKGEEKPRRSIRSSLRNAFGPSSGTVYLSGLLIFVVRMARAAVDSARQEDAPGIVNFVLRCCVNALLSGVDYLNKFTINFAAITGEAYCSSARMTYELLRRNLLSVAFVETISSRLLVGIVFVLSAVYTIVAWLILKAVSDLGGDSYFVAALAWALLILVLGFFVHVLENVIDTIYVCYAIDRDRGEVFKQEVHDVYVHLPISRSQVQSLGTGALVV
ncbi:hypothetical protein L6164_037622 [Bauhinia variegata]|uniref:Uncharacterized protein n=1 Tax=Bauhinia variegata TaxID=167791 RepID=A0ACB9KKR4_BAUVA|nr:hypothetical protein L6164_037622 [Bauhinia variegata]